MTRLLGSRPADAQGWSRPHTTTAGNGSVRAAAKPRSPVWAAGSPPRRSQRTGSCEVIGCGGRGSRQAPWPPPRDLAGAAELGKGSTRCPPSPGLSRAPSR